MFMHYINLRRTTTLTLNEQWRLERTGRERRHISSYSKHYTKYYNSLFI